MRLLPGTLRGRLIALLLGALLAAQALSLVFLVDERGAAVRTALAFEAADRAANVVRLIEASPVALRPSILKAANSPFVRFAVDPRPEVAGQSTGDARIRARIEALIDAGAGREVRIELRRVRGHAPARGDLPPDMARMHERMNAGHMSAVEMRLAIALADGGWLNVSTRFLAPAFQWAWPAIATFLLTAALLALVLWFALGGLVRPIRRLAENAERFGKGEAVAPLAPRGPEEIRHLAQALADMQARISRFVGERTRLLGALGHDLRSPLTALRVRAEMVEDEDTRTRLVATIEEMNEMVEATLAFARGTAAGEGESECEVAFEAFLGDLAGEFAESGQPVTFGGAPAITLRLRRNAMRRALRNLIENAVRYGGGAVVSGAAARQTVTISVADRGPGIAEDALKRVFDPFVRLEDSRSRETGGAGLGLSIARTIAEAHGGEVVLANRPKGGLMAEIRLPR